MALHEITLKPSVEKDLRVLSKPGKKAAQLPTSACDDWVTGSPPKRLV